MSVQDDKAADQDKVQQSDEDQQTTEKPEPDEEQKQKAAEMMTAYEDRPTLVLPGTGGKVSGTAVNDWLDEDGNPKGTTDDVGSDDNRVGSDNKGSDDKAQKEQIEKDKAWNEELREAAAAENKGEKGKKR
ncbi:MAG TPA: hypothetical protein VLL82_17365 [Mycobacterium sp.]|nr:hypothetical protein [Mycobacterium sp.]